MQNRIRIAACVIRKDGNYLLVQEKKPKAYGLWNLPAGHVDEGETYEQAAMREVKEETGYVVRLERLIRTEVVTRAEHEYEVYIFKATIIDGSLVFPTDELLDAGWKSVTEVKRLQTTGKMRTDWVYDSIATIEEETQH